MESQTPDRLYRSFFSGFPLIALLGALASKAWVAYMFGPHHMGDNTIYIQFADLILRDSSWLSDAFLDKEAIPTSAWRLFGYPLMIAIMKLIAGENWFWLIYVFQSALSLYAGYCLFKLCQTIGLSLNLSAFVFLAYHLSVPLSTDLIAMPESFHGSLMTIILTTGGRHLLEDNFNKDRWLGMGLLLSLALLLRDGAHYYLVFILPIFGLFGYFLKTNLRTLGICLILFSTPVLVTYSAYTQWNKFRTGSAFLSTGAQTAIMAAIYVVAQVNEDIFHDDTPLDRAIKDNMGIKGYQASKDVSYQLFEKDGLDAVQIKDLVWARFFQTIKEYPLDYLRSVKTRLLIGQQASMVLGPVTRINDLQWWYSQHGGPPYYIGWRKDWQTFLNTLDFQTISLENFLLGLPKMVFRIIALGIFALFVIFPLWRIIKSIKNGGEISRRDLFFLAAWALYFANYGLYLIVNMEVRYLGGICWIPILLGYTYLGELPWVKKAMSRD